jgi:hypothetical protein
LDKAIRSIGLSFLPAMLPVHLETDKHNGFTVHVIGYGEAKKQRLPGAQL